MKKFTLVYSQEIGILQFYLVMGPNNKQAAVLQMWKINNWIHFASIMSALCPTKSNASYSFPSATRTAGNSFSPVPMCSLTELHNEFFWVQEEGEGNWNHSVLGLDVSACVCMLGGK